MDLLPLAPDLEKKAREELNENPETRLHYLKQLRERLKERPDLKFRTSNIDLICFLRARKFNVDLAYKLFVRHYEAKQNHPEVFENFSPSAERSTFDSGYNIAFPDRDQQGRKIFALRPGKWNPYEQDLLNIFRADLIAFQILLQDEATQINGVVIIVDFRDFGMAQARAMNPLTFKRFSNIVFNCYPLRIKGVHILEQPKIFTVIYALSSQFMKEKLRERLKLHSGNIQGLVEYIKHECLPVDYGGTAPGTNIKNWVKYIMSSQKTFEHLWC